MSINKRIRSMIRSFGDKFLPDTLYFQIYSPLFLIGNRNRRGSATQFEVVGKKLYRASDPDGTTLLFCERSRLGLYHYPKGVRGRINTIAEKYSEGTVAVERGDVVIDIGANIGEFTRAVAPFASRVIAIEPDPNVHDALTKNIDGLPNAYSLRYALSDQEGEADFYISTKTADSSLMEPESHSSVVKIRTCTLDSVTKEVGINRIDFLKLEAEGWEPEILAGAAQTLAITEKVAVDAGPERQGATTTDAVSSALSNAGFHVYQRNNIVFAVRLKDGT